MAIQPSQINSKPSDLEIVEAYRHEVIQALQRRIRREPTNKSLPALLDLITQPAPNTQ